jgi:Na+/proline symporter/signal transduction histidine kinase
MNSWHLIVVIVSYLGLLFALAYWAEHNKNNKWLNSAWIYALSLAVYSSAWTYYGSIGTAATTGLQFLPIYLGPVIAFPIWVLVMRKTIRIAKIHKVSSIADFLSVRYGQSRRLGALVALVLILGVVPYISLQLKAVSETFAILTGNNINHSVSPLYDTAFYIALLLAVFAAIYGTQKIDATEKHKGIVFSTAIESLVKLFFFLVLGVYVTFYLFQGPSDLFHRMENIPYFENLITLNNESAGFNWFFAIAMSFFAIFLLPRQFQVTVVENHNENEIKRAIWFFPLYLLIFNIFTPFIAWAGIITFGGASDPDYFALSLPLHQGNTFLALLVFVGGLSAVVSMVVISTLALSTMVSNNLVIPYGFLNKFIKEAPETNIAYIKSIRRISVFLVIVTAYIFYKNFSVNVSLVSIGILSFVVVSQLAPSYFLGLYWNRGNFMGAFMGIIAGISLTAYTLIAPFIVETFTGASHQFIELGPWGISALRPYSLLNTGFLSPSAHAFFWSMIVNFSVYVFFSLTTKGNYRERNFAELFVHNYRLEKPDENGYVWKGEAYVTDIKALLSRFLGPETANRELAGFFVRNRIDPKTEAADARLVSFSETLLAGSIGAASSKILISSVVKEEQITLSEVLGILEESKENMARKRSLEEKSRELLVISKKLKEANLQLIFKDKQKNDFLDTVAHELKTPLSGIRAASEILIEEDDISESDKMQFLTVIMNETDRLSRLINNILDFEKFSAGRQKMHFERNEIKLTVDKSIASIKQLAGNKKIWIHKKSFDTIVLEYDEDRIIQVITNLLSNAIKFTEYEKGYISIDCKTIDRNLELTVENSGKSIQQDDLPFIFDKFYQSHEQTTKKPVGSGLGLAICKHIIEEHNGNIWAHANVKNGAKFTFSIPIKQPIV